MSKEYQTGEDGARPDNGNQFGRRRFLTWMARGSLAAIVVAATGQVVRFLSFQPPDSASTIIPVGQPGNYLRSSLVYVADGRVYIGRDRSGLYALDAVCTHLGCLVQQKEEGGFVCPCHESHFDVDGQPESGPASQPLRYLQLSLDQESGQLLVDRAQPVEPVVRLVI
jgi:Rieske Fe-S protein